jgi:hypothetical protein
MSANATVQGNDLLDAAIAFLRAKLPSSWTIEASTQVVATPSGSSAQLDGTIYLLVEAKRSILPRDAERLFSGLGQRMRLLNPSFPVLVVAPWISTRTQEILESQGINFLDLTGNARIALDYPPIFISTEGANRDPAPPARPKASLRGPKAGRLFRFLADVAAPYGVSQIAAITNLAPGYISRLLEALDDEAIIQRTRRGQVVSADVSSLLRRWAESYDVFKTNNATSFVAPDGPTNLLERLGATKNVDRIAVTGSFAAVRLAPVAGPALLLAYTSDPGTLATQLKLLPTDRGANVVLLRPFDVAVWERTTEANGVNYVAVSQVAVDCLTGNGRMPSEGEALLEWMEANESRWRFSSIDALGHSQMTY